MANRKYQFIEKHGKIVRRSERRKGYTDEVSAEFVRLLNAKYRAKAKARMQQEDYENLPVFVRNARYWWWWIW